MYEMPDIAAKVLEAKGRKASNRPVHVNHASEIGHPCERYLVLLRTNWKDRKIHSAQTECIFEAGRVMEGVSLRDLEEAGFQVIEQQRTFDWPALQLTGHLDAKVVIDGKAYPWEVKSLNHFDWLKMNSFEDFIHARKYWLRKYPAQMTTYLLLTGSELGAIYLKDKATWLPKVIWIRLDYDYAESLLKKVERVNEHVKNGTRPEGINDPLICGDCPLNHVCLPAVTNEPLEMLDDEELLDKLKRRDELSNAHFEYLEIDEEVKAQIKGRKIAVGDYLITGRWVEPKGKSRYWVSQITRCPD